jgi:hypothetical protein
MEVNRTGTRNAHLDNAQMAKPKGARFNSPLSSSAGADTTSGAAGGALAVTQADLADPGKTEETLRRCFGGLVDDSSRQLGVSPSDSQKRDLVEFLGNDPLMRGKLLNYLDQVVK